MRVSRGESVCPPPAPAPTQAAGKMGGALHCGWMSGWVGVGDAVLKSHLVHGEKGPDCLLSPSKASPPRIRPGLPHPPRPYSFGLGCVLPWGGGGNWGGPRLGGDRPIPRWQGLPGEWRQ